MSQWEIVSPPLHVVFFFFFHIWHIVISFRLHLRPLTVHLRSPCRTFMAVLSRFRRPPTHVHSSAVSLAPFVCLFYMKSNPHKHTCVHYIVHCPNRIIIILHFSPRMEKNHKEEKKKKRKSTQKGCF